MNTGEMAVLGMITETLAGRLLWVGDNSAPCTLRAETTGPEGEPQVLTLRPDDTLELQDWYMAGGPLVALLRAAMRVPVTSA